MQTVFPEHGRGAAQGRVLRRTRRGSSSRSGPTIRASGSQTFALEQAGWRGVLVEPQPDSRRSCGQIRSRTGLPGGVLLAAKCRRDHDAASCRACSPRSIADLAVTRRAAERRDRRAGPHTRRYSRPKPQAPCADRFPVDRHRRPRARGACGFRFRALAAAIDPDRGSRDESRQASAADACGLPADPPHRAQRLVCAGAAAPRLGLPVRGRSRASITLRCRSASCAS